MAGDCNANGDVDCCEILDDPDLDANGNLRIDSCEADIPTVSEWGLAVLALLLLSAA